MSRSSIPTAREVLRLLRIVGGLNALPVHDLAARKAHVLNGLCRLMGGKVGLSGDGVGFSEGKNPTFTSAAEGGWFGNSERRVVGGYLAGRHDADPLVWPLIRQRPRITVRLRRELVTDLQWYSSPHVNDYRKLAGINDCIYMFERRDSAGSIRMMGLHRPWGDRTPFTERDRTLVGLLYRAVAPHLDPPPSALHLAATKLAPRLRRTLDLLLQGFDTKKIAHESGLSAHTVNEYIKSLFVHFEVSSRTELLAKWLRDRSSGGPSGYP